MCGCGDCVIVVLVVCVLFMMCIWVVLSFMCMGCLCVNVKFMIVL